MLMLMQMLLNGTRTLRKDEKGASAIEYAVMAAVLVAVIILAIQLLDLDGVFTDINTAIDAAA
ncbi:Flp family type IVb pilin [Spongiibacter sp.]|uniref:Flp family type IVb pilin n=1 Tax=Spongiibacter sp. TaxID=2024860 RepID=UPI003569EB0F